MAEITRKRTGELLRALFELLMPQADGMPAGVALKALLARCRLDQRSWCRTLFALDGRPPRSVNAHVALPHLPRAWT